MVDIASAIALERSDGSGSDLLYWSRASLALSRRIARISRLRRDAASGDRLMVLEDAFRAMAMAMEFGFLFDRRANCSRSDFLVPNPL